MSSHSYKIEALCDVEFNPVLWYMRQYHVAVVQELMCRLKDACVWIKNRRWSLAVSPEVGVVDLTEGSHKLSHIRYSNFQSTGWQRGCRARLFQIQELTLRRKMSERLEQEGNNKQNNQIIFLTTYLFTQLLQRTQSGLQQSSSFSYIVVIQCTTSWIVRTPSTEREKDQDLEKSIKLRLMYNKVVVDRLN